MTIDIVRHEPQASLPDKMEWARALASSNLLPRQYQNNPGNLLFAIEYADALGVNRMAAITSIHVIEGKPSASADLIANLVRKAGHRLRVMGDDTFAEVHLIRADDPEFTYEARWDLTKARTAGLLGKNVWKNYPGAMLRSRAITEVARMGASDALFGVIYTPEELGAEVDSDGDTVHRVTTARAGAGADRARDALGVTPQTDDPEGSQAETPGAGGEAGSIPAGTPSGSSEADGITAPQIRKLGAAMRDAGLNDRDAALAYVAKVIGRTVDSRNDLTKDEASRVIDALDQEASVPADPTDDVVDAELVDDQEEAAAIWDRVVSVSEQMGWSMDQLTQDFTGRMSMAPAEAAAAELDAYLGLLKDEVAA